VGSGPCGTCAVQSAASALFRSCTACILGSSPTTNRGLKAFEVGLGALGHVSCTVSSFRSTYKKLLHAYQGFLVPTPQGAGAFDVGSGVPGTVSSFLSSWKLSSHPYKWLSFLKMPLQIGTGTPGTVSSFRSTWKLPLQITLHFSFSCVSGSRVMAYGVKRKALHAQGHADTNLEQPCVTSRAKTPGLEPV
jgi:hypothetical protein